MSPLRVCLSLAKKNIAHLTFLPLKGNLTTKSYLKFKIWPDLTKKSPKHGCKILFYVLEIKLGLKIVTKQLNLTFCSFH